MERSQNPATDEVRWRVKTSEARSNIRQLLDSVEHDGARVLVDRYNRPSVVMVHVEWYLRAQEALGEDFDWAEGSQ